MTHSISMAILYTILFITIGYIKEKERLVHSSRISESIEVVTKEKVIGRCSRLFGKTGIMVCKSE